MNPTHTPGPWKVIGKEQIVDADEISVATITQWIDPYSDTQEEKDHDIAECAANARLIAAAPDLLAACETMLNAPPVTGDPQLDLAALLSRVEQIKAAITKARGQAA